MPTYLYQIKDTEETFEWVHKMSDPKPATVKELFTLMGRKLPDGYDPKGEVVRLINCAGGVVINGHAYSAGPMPSINQPKDTVRKGYTRIMVNDKRHSAKKKRKPRKKKTDGTK